jgi:hypothetical protein
MNSKVANVSGYHLLRQYTDQKPDVLVSEVKSAMHAGGVVWKKASSSDEADAAPARWANLDFLGKGQPRRVWENYWPQDDYRFLWDAIGKVQIGRVGWEWLLVTAFAHPEELEQNLELPVHGIDERFVLAMEEAKQSYNVAPGNDWIHSNTSLTTRYSALRFLRVHGACVRMLFIYFYDDETKKDALCPGLKEWDPAISTTERRLGLTGNSVLERRIYRAFLPAICH